MNLEDLRKICLSLPSVTEDVKWENHLCFSIGRKIFLITGMEETPVTASFKVSDDEFDQYINREGFQAAPYLARYKWIYTHDVRMTSHLEWKKIISKSYELIRSKLPAKVKQALDNQTPGTPSQKKNISTLKKKQESKMQKIILENLRIEFEKLADKNKAEAMAAYMKNKFVFLGLQMPVRESVLKPWMKEITFHENTELEKACLWLWNQEEREFHYAGMTLLHKFKNLWTKESIHLIEKLITTNSWWDTVDFIAANLAGIYFEKFPDKKQGKIREWIRSENMWLNRSAILFQLKYKEKTDQKLLYDAIIPHLGSSEFFLQKAIGWALRQYAYSEPGAVKQFVKSHDLKPLSEREAMKHLRKK